MAGEDGVTQAILGAMDDAGIRETADPEPVADSTPAEAPETPAPDQGAESAPPPVEDEEAELKALEAEIGKDPKIRGRIDIRRHQAVLTRNRRKYEAEIAAREERLKGYAKYDDPTFKAKSEAWDLAERDPDRFLRYLAAESPQYRERLRALLDPPAAPEPPKAPVAAVPEDDPEPKPDRLGDDGELTYSTAQAAKKVAWEVRQHKRELQAAFDKRLEENNKRFDPLLKAEQERQRYQTFRQQAQKEEDHARANWKGYKDNEAEIQKVFLANPNYRLFDAYRDVVINGYESKIAKLEAETRAKVIKELNAAPAAPARPTPGDKPDAAEDSNKSTDDRVTDAIRQGYRKLAAAERV